MASTTTFGRFLVNEELPTKYHVKGELTKKTLHDHMYDLAREDPTAYAKSIARLKTIGDKVATLEGMSVGLDDIEPAYTKRNAVLRPYMKKFQEASSDTQRRAAAQSAQEKMIDVAMLHKGTLTQQVRSGARGKPFQYSNIVGAPGAARDVDGKTVPWMLDRSYSEGLTPAQYWAAGNEAIMNTIKSNVAVSEPGELSKILINNMSDIIITGDDCGTDNGIAKISKSGNIVDRFLARDTGRFKKGTLITSDVQNKLLKSKVKKIIVRSPMTCEHGDGVCQKCQGLNEWGELQEMGTNVGIRAAQALSEPLTQMALSTKHGGKTTKAEQLQVGGLLGFRQTIESPKQFINKATVSSKPGKVDKIEKAPQGGHFVYVGKDGHYVTPNLDVTVEKGDEVEAGDVLSEGIPKPDEVVHYKGLGPGRLYMVNRLKDIYRGQGLDIDQRHFELVAKGELNYAKILEDPSNQFISGDVVSYNNLRKVLAKGTKEIPINDSLGETLGKEYLHFSAGSRVTPSMRKALKKEKIDAVQIAPRPPVVEFVMKPATRAPLLNPDWMARLAHRNLKEGIMRGAHFGETSNIHGTHPVPAYAFGAEFGTGKSGRY